MVIFRRRCSSRPMKKMVKPHFLQQRFNVGEERRNHTAAVEFIPQRIDPFVVRLVCVVAFGEQQASTCRPKVVGRDGAMTPPAGPIVSVTPSVYGHEKQLIFKGFLGQALPADPDLAWPCPYPIGRKRPYL